MHCGIPAPTGPLGFGSRVKNASVEEDVLYFVFPGSSFSDGELTLDNITTKVKERAFSLYDQLRGAS